MSLFGQSSGGSLFSSPNNPKITTTNPFAATPNTAPAQQSGLFTNTTTGGGGLFGSGTTSQPQQSGGLFGNSTATPPQQSGGGLFGAPATSQPQQSSGGLFGNTATPTTSGGLFGSSTATSQPQAGGLFGGQAATTNNQTTGGLFGNAQSSQPQQSNSLFGNTTNQATSGSSLFSNNAQNPQQKPNPFGGSLFSGAQTNTSTNQQQQSSLFSQPQQQQQSSLFGGAPRLGGLGTSTSQQQQQTVPGVKIDVSQLRGTTRFNDLHEDLQKQIEQMDAFIQQQIMYKEQCEAMIPAHGQSVDSLAPDVDYLQNNLETCELSIENDSAALNGVKEIVETDIENARIGFRAVENLRLPQQFHYSGVWNSISRSKGGIDIEGNATASGSTDLLTFFDASATASTAKLEKDVAILAEIESHLGVVEANTALAAQQVMFKRGRDGGARSRDDQIAELYDVLRQFEGGIVNVAEAVGRVRESTIDVMEAGQGGMR